MCVEVGEADFADILILKQIVRTRRSLEPGSENKHAHQ
jgi:hypothetical protein